MSDSDEEPSCSVCFCPPETNDQIYHCSDNLCQEFTCSDCMPNLINYSANNNVMPTCPHQDCNAFYIKSNLTTLPQPLTIIYNKACLNYMMHGQGDIVKKRIEEKKMLNNLRKERFRLLEANFPAAITLVAQLTFKSKLRRLDKQKSKFLKNQLKNSHKACPNATCGGFLNNNMSCMTCGTDFCNQCEQELRTRPHQCKQEDLDSINLINDMVKCPECKLPIFRASGCNHMRCSNCGTNFLYTTGKAGGSGNGHNSKITVNISKKFKLSHMYSSMVKQSTLNLILQVEALEPPLVSKDTLLQPLTYFIKTKKEAVCGKSLAARMDKYILNRNLNKFYHKQIVAIEKLIKRKTPEPAINQNLTQIIRRVNSSVHIVK